MGFPPQNQNDTQTKSIKSVSSKIGMGLVLLMGLSYVLPPIVLSFLEIVDPEYRIQDISQNVPVNLIYDLLSVAIMVLPFLLVCKLVKAPRKAVFPSSAKGLWLVLPACGLALGASVVGGIVSSLLSTFFAIFGTTPIMGDFSMPEGFLPALLFIINLSVIVPIAEEFVFRGVVLGTLRQYGDAFAIGVSAILFALLHRNMVQFPNALIMGLILGYFVVRTDSLWTGIILHGVNNFTAIGVSSLALNFPENYGLVALCCYGIMLSAGFVSLIYLASKREHKLVLQDRAGDIPPKKRLAAFFTSPWQIIAVGLMFISIISNFSTV